MPTSKNPGAAALLRGYMNIGVVKAVDWVMEQAHVVRTARAGRATKCWNLLLSAGFAITLRMDGQYFARSTYLRPVDAALGGTELLALFSLVSILNAASLGLSRDDEDLRTLPVYLLRQGSYLVSFCFWLFVLILNNAAMRAAGSGALWPLTLLCAGLAVMCALCFLDTCNLYLTNTKIVFDGRRPAPSPPPPLAT